MSVDEAAAVALIVGFAVVAALAAGFGRVHYVSDVQAGWLLGAVGRRRHPGRIVVGRCPPDPHYFVGVNRTAARRCRSTASANSSRVGTR